MVQRSWTWNANRYACFRKANNRSYFDNSSCRGKFSEDGGYKTSGGLHGVGASVVNALSHWLEVTVCRDGKIFKQRFEDGGETIGKLTVIGKTKETGTLIHFYQMIKFFQQ